MDIPKIKKEISLFLNSEEAKVLKKDIGKLGLAASVIAGILAQAQNSQAAHSDHSDHDSGVTHTDSVGPHASHDSHTDGPTHNDSASHVDSHNSALGAHSSQPVYDAVKKRGGHNSRLVHSNT